MTRTAITIRIREEEIERLDQEANEEGVSRSEYIRQILDNRDRVDQLEEEMSELRDRLESREERIDDLEQQLARRSQIEDKVEQVAMEVREGKEEENAPFFVRWYRWWSQQQR